MFVQTAPLGHRIDYDSFSRPFLDNMSNERLDRNSSRGTEDARDDQRCQLFHIKSTARCPHEAAGRAPHGVGSGGIGRIQVIVVDVRVPLHAFCHLRERDAFLCEWWCLWSYRNGRVGVWRRDDVPLRRGTATRHLGCRATRRLRAVPRPKLWGSPLRFTGARAACRPAGQPLWYNYVVPTPLLKPGSPKLPFWQYLRRELCYHGQTSAFISKKGEKPVPRPVINLEQSFLRPFLRLEALAFY